MNIINTSTWSDFRIGDLFTKIDRAKRRTINDYSAGDVPYVTNSMINNGVSSYLQPKSDDDIEHGRCITVNSVDGSAFWQENDFLANSSGNGLLMLRNDDLNDMRALFVCASITAVLEAGFTIMLTLNVLRETTIRLPSTPSGEPDWDYMETTMKDITAERERALDFLMSL